jgi:long-chain acyl-CoA synthetase
VGPALLIANHTSHLDGPTVLAALPPGWRRRTAVAAAADYFFRSTPLGTFASLALGAFPFHREGAISASLSHCGDLIDEGYSILIFPEGTRSPDGHLLPFKPGIGLLARELGVPVVPVHLTGLEGILPKGRTWPQPGPVVVRIGEAVHVPRTLSNAEATDILEAAVRRLAGASDR